MKWFGWFRRKEPNIITTKSVIPPVDLDQIPTLSELVDMLVPPVAILDNAGKIRSYDEYIFGSGLKPLWHDPAWD
jgi:hypothetical protein